jgi:hypothetical protein
MRRNDFCKHPMSDLRKGLQHRDGFRAEAGGEKGPISLKTFNRWMHLGLPVVTIRRMPYVCVGEPYEFTAADWFRNGMKPPAPPQPRRRKVSA